MFLIGIDLIDVDGLRRIYAPPTQRVHHRRHHRLSWSSPSGVEQGIILAIVALAPRDHPAPVQAQGLRRRRPPRRHADVSEATPGTQSEPGLIVFRYDADLFYANANRFVDDIEALIDHAPDPVRWVVLDAGAMDDIDYSAGISLAGLLDYLDARHITFALARADDAAPADAAEVRAARAHSGQSSVRQPRRGRARLRGVDSGHALTGGSGYRC